MPADFHVTSKCDDERIYGQAAVSTAERPTDALPPRQSETGAILLFPLGDADASQDTASYPCARACERPRRQGGKRYFQARTRVRWRRRPESRQQNDPDRRLTRLTGRSCRLTGRPCQLTGGLGAHPQLKSRGAAAVTRFGAPQPSVVCAATADPFHGVGGRGPV
jgi:hypothetical protein